MRSFNANLGVLEGNCYPLLSMAKHCKCSLQKNMKYGPYFRRMLRGHYRLGLSYSTNTGNFLGFYGRLTFAYVYFLLGYIEKYMVIILSFIQISS